jgi:hypothetical protein
MIRALPDNFKSKVSYLPNYSKAPIRILPQQSGALKNNQILKIVLPVGVVLDLSTFAIHFDFVAKQGNHAAVAADNTVGMGKYTSSLFENFECFVNGRSVQNIQCYNRIYSILKDFKSNHASQLRKLSNNSDPSVYETLANNGTITKVNTKHAVAGEAYDFAGRYVVDDFIGILNCQPNIIDTNICGAIELSWRLAGPEVLWKTAGGARTGVSFEISNVVAYCDAIYFKDENYNSQIKVAMEQADGFKITYDNFGVYTGDVIGGGQGATKTTTLKCTENCKSLDYLLYTYFDTTSTGLQPLQLGDAAVAGDEAALVAGQVPASRYNFDNLCALRDTSLLNNSVWFRRNGVATNLKVEFQINSQPITVPMNIQEQWEETQKCFENHLDADNKSINPAIHSLAVFQKDFYVAGLSLSHIGNKNPDLMPLISGRDTQATSINLLVNATESGADASHGNCQPFLITKMTSMLHITGQRDVLPSR